MPIQAPQWTDYLSCGVCCREFGAPPRSPVSLPCGHTLCSHCLNHLHRKQCPFDQTVIQIEPSELVVNTAVLQLAGYTPPPQPYHPPAVQALAEPDRRAYDAVVKCMEHLALYLKYGSNVCGGGCRLSRPMQRKLVTLIQCATTDAEGRGRAARAARSLGERTVTELILQHQNPQQLSANLWAAVRARGCQFLGPAMQEEVLKLVLLALEDGSALSRKVLVMFVVQRLEPHFPQASKTSIGHVVQLLYRASCFKVSKRECDSSLMQLKEEFRTYECLRREHDAQIVQIATEAGLRIAPDQWSALLYGDAAHKSHMQSIIDKLQTPQSFAQSVQELFIALQRTGDPAHLIAMSGHLDRLAAIEPNPDAKNPSWQELAEVMCSLKEVVSGLVHFLQQQAAGRDANHNHKHDEVTGQPSPQTRAVTPTPNNKYKVLMCRDAATRSYCPRGSACTFAHSEEEMERYRSLSSSSANGNFSMMQNLPLPVPQAVVSPMYSPRYPPPMPPQGMAQLDNYQQMNAMAPPMPSAEAMSTDYTSPSNQNVDLQNTQYAPPMMLPAVTPPVGPPMGHSGGPTVANQPMGQTGISQPMGQPGLSQAMAQPGMSQAMAQPGMNQAMVQSNISQSRIPQPGMSQAGLIQPGMPTTVISQQVISQQVLSHTEVAATHLGVSQVPPATQSGAAQNGISPLGDRYVRYGREELMYNHHDFSHLYRPINIGSGVPEVVNPNIYVPVPPESTQEIRPYTFEDRSQLQGQAGAFAAPPRDHRTDAPVPWTPQQEVFSFDGMRKALPHASGSDDMYKVPDRRPVGTADRIVSDCQRADDHELEEELQALERRIDTEFKNTD